MICAEYKTIFVHIPKAAGQSIEHFFLGKIGKTWDERAALLIRDNYDPTRGPFRLEHLFASEYLSCNYITEKDFDASFKFAVVRNPWARLVSAYKFSVERRGRVWVGLSFSDFIARRFPAQISPLERSIVFRHLEPQWKFVCDATGGRLVNDILRFETLDHDFTEVSRHIFGKDERLPVSNVSGNKTDYRDFYDEPLKLLVERLYERDIELFGYSFDSG